MGVSSFPPLRLLLAAIWISFLCTFPGGYGIGVVNISQRILERFVNQSIYDHYNYALNNHQLSIIWALVVNIPSVGGILGSISATFFAEKYGRKRSMLLSNGAILAASILTGISKWCGSMELLVIGRMFTSFSSGVAMSILVVYIPEVSPVQHRGLASTFINFFVTASTLISEIVSLPFALGTERLWPFLLGLTGLTALLQLSTGWIFPESPSYLLLAKGNEQEARKSIKYFHGERADSDAVLERFRKERELAPRQLTLKEAFTHRDFRWFLLVVAVINIARMTSGIVAIFSYSTVIYESVGMPTEWAPYASVITSLFNLGGSFISLPVVGRVGRRPLMLIGLSICVICDILFMVFSLWQQYSGHQWPVYVALVALITHVTVFNIGPGPVGAFISSELTPQSVRSIGASVCMTTLMVTVMAVGFAYLPLQEAVGPWSFLLFIIPTSLAIVFLWFYMLETKDKTIDQVMDEWKRRTTKVGTESKDITEAEKF